MANDNEQQFTIQPHPAKTNNPADLTQDPSGGGGLLGTNPNALVGGVATGPGLQVLSDEQARGLEKPKGREEVERVDLAFGGGNEIRQGRIIKDHQIDNTGWRSFAITHVAGSEVCRRRTRVLPYLRYSDLL
ncbi:hypothetical protein QFC22_005705 [Naganishia vaughanmartiniae]|uniref:Uncharacterized protein n=1 Tax=Naganishia vaughanmartiniae TaxID=1424756 RepID=A0ACC2WS03_9TREE|nr:hypothetical protein QFC22_005705 [Naganishia vaughanmartiniae]